MPRRTPVREIKEAEENLSDTPVRRSTRIAATTPVGQGAKVTTRRSSSSSDTGSQPAKLTRRMSLTQESKESETPKRSTRSASKSPTMLVKEHGHKATPTVSRTRRASTEESSQSDSSALFDSSRRTGRRGSTSEKIPPLKKIEETDPTKSQKRLSRARSSNSESNSLDKTESTANMATIPENDDEDREVQVIDDMKTKSPVVVMERMNRKSLEEKTDIMEKKKINEDKKDEDKKEKESEITTENDIVFNDGVITEENTVKSNDKEIVDKTNCTKADPEKQQILEGLPKTSAINDEDADIIQDLDLNLKVTPEKEIEPKNLDNSSSSDKENSSINVPKEITSGLKDNSDIPDLVTNIPAVTEESITVVASYEEDKTVIPHNLTKRNSLEKDNIFVKSDDKELQIIKPRKSASPVCKPDQEETDNNEVVKPNLIKTIRSRKSVSPDFESDKANDEEITSKKDESVKEVLKDSNISPGTPSKLSDDNPQEKELSSNPREEDKLDNSTSNIQVSISRTSEKSTITKSTKDTPLPETPLKDQEKENKKPTVTTESDEKITPDKNKKREEAESEDSLTKQDSETNNTVAVQETIIEKNKEISLEVDKQVEKSSKSEEKLLTEHNHKINEDMTEKPLIKPETPTETTTFEITLHIKTQEKKNILKERENFNDVINESKSNMPQEKEPLISSSNENEDSVAKINKNKKVTKGTDIDVNESVLNINNETPKENARKSSEKIENMSQQIDDQEKIDSVSPKKCSKEDDHISDENLKEENGVEAKPNIEKQIQIDADDNLKQLEKNDSEVLISCKQTPNESEETKISSEKLNLESDRIDNQKDSDAKLQISEKNADRCKTGDLSTNEGSAKIKNDKVPNEEPKEHLKNSKQEQKIANIKKAKSLSKQQTEDDVLCSFINESELADINEFLDQIIKDDDSEETTASKSSQVSPKKKTGKLAKSSSQKSGEPNKSKEKQKTVKTSDDQSENSFRETVDNILKSKALDSDNEEADKEPVNEFIDDMAEEVDEEEDGFDDSNDIPCEGESINSSDTESDNDSEEDNYENDSFIDDEEENNELLSGDEDFLINKAAEKKKGNKEKKRPVVISSDKKYARIVTCDSSGSDVEVGNVEGIDAGKKSKEQEPIIVEDENSKDNFEKLTGSKNNLPASESAEVISVEHEQEQDSARSEENATICVDSDSEDSVINIKIDPNDRSRAEMSRRSSIRKSSINIQENISLQDIEDGDLSDRITKVVEWFCSGIKTSNDMSGNISLNVSLDYNDGQNEDASLMKIQEAPSATKKRKSTEPSSVEDKEYSPVKIRKVVEEKGSSFTEQLINEPSQSSVAVEIAEENVAFTKIEPSTSSKTNKSKKSTEYEEENEEDVFSPTKVKKMILPSSSKKKKSKKTLEATDGDFNVSVQDEASPTKTEETPNDDFIVSVRNDDTEMLSPMKTKEPLLSKKKKPKKTVKSVSDDFDFNTQNEDIEVYSITKKGESSTEVSPRRKKKSKLPSDQIEEIYSVPADESEKPMKVDIDLDQPSVSGLGMKKFKDVKVTNQATTEDSSEVTERNKRKLPKTLLEMGDGKVSTYNKKKKFEIEGNEINEEELVTPVDIKKKSKKKSDESLITGEKKISEVSSPIKIKMNTELAEVNRGKKRTKISSIAQKMASGEQNSTNIENIIPRKQRKVENVLEQDVEMESKRIKRLKMQHLDDWSNISAKVTPSLSELPEKNQSKKKGKTQKKNPLVPTLNMGDSAWDIEPIIQKDTEVSTQMRIVRKKRNAGTSKVTSFHPKDFKNQMLHCMGRVDRMDAKILLRNKKEI